MNLNPLRWLRRRRNHKKIIEMARSMEGMTYCWPPRDGMEAHWMPGTFPQPPQIAPGVEGVKDS